MGSAFLPPLLADLLLAAWALVSFLLVGVAGLRLLGRMLPDGAAVPAAGSLEEIAFGAGLGVLVHALAGLAIALAPAKGLVAGLLFFLLWAGALGVLATTRRRKPVAASTPTGSGGVRPVLAMTALFIAGCVTLTHLEIRFPRELPDGAYIFKQHRLPVKIQVLTGSLPADNFIPFVVTEFLLRDIPFARERPLLPGQEVSNRPILLALAAIPFRAVLDPPPRREVPLPRFSYVQADWPDVSVFMEGPGFRQFLPVGIVLNALLILGAGFILATYAPRTLLMPALLLLATSPYFITQTIFTWPKALAGFFVLLAVHALARGKSASWVAGCGALGYWAHPYALVFLLSFGCHYGIEAWRARNRAALGALLRYGAVAAAGIAPWFLWTHFVLGIPSNLVEQNLAAPGGALRSRARSGSGCKRSCAPWRRQTRRGWCRLTPGRCFGRRCAVCPACSGCLSCRPTWPVRFAGAATGFPWSMACCCRRCCSRCPSVSKRR